MNAVLDIRNLTRVHGSGDQAVRALSGVDLAVAAGELVALMGPSGSGKSTLLTCAGGFDQPTSGEVLVDGQDLVTLGRNAVAALRRRRIGYVFQDFNLIPALTAAENVSLPLELDGARSRSSMRDRSRANGPTIPRLCTSTHPTSRRATESACTPSIRRT
jgi:putative ABC transport system ATP-binding protein